MLVRGHEHPPHGGPDAQKREGVLRDGFEDDPIDAAAGVQPGPLRLKAEEPAEHVGQLPVVLQIAKRHAVRHLDVPLVERGNRDELVRSVDWQRPEEKRVDDREDAGAGADAEGERQDGRRREARRPSERAHRVADVLAQHRQVLARSGGQQVVHRLEPEARRGSRGPFVARIRLLRPEHLLHLAAVLQPEVEREKAEQRAEGAVRSRATVGCRHGYTFRGRSFLARAIPTIASSRDTSASATERPSVVSR